MLMGLRGVLTVGDVLFVTKRLLYDDSSQEAGQNSILSGTNGKAQCD